jgi:hypothetical protein
MGRRGPYSRRAVQLSTELLAVAEGAVLSCRAVPGYVSKFLSPKVSHSRRWRKVRAVLVWLIVGMVIVGVVAGLLYLMYTQRRP